MQIGTKLSHLQKCRRLGQQTSEAITTNRQKLSNTRYTAEVFFPNPKYEGNPGSEPSAHPRLLSTTKPAHPDTVLQCTRLICRTDMFEKRVGRENGMA